FRSARHCRTCPTHRIHVQLVRRGRKQLRFSRSPRPAFPNRIFLQVYVLEADGLHLRRRPLLRTSLRRRSRHARTHVIAQFRQLLTRGRFPHAPARTPRPPRLPPAPARSLRPVPPPQPPPTGQPHPAPRHCRHPHAQLVHSQALLAPYQRTLPH